MDKFEKVKRALATRLGSRPGNPMYGTRLYLLRDRKLDGDTSLLFVKYVFEDITRSEPTIEVKEAKLISIDGDKLTGSIIFTDGEAMQVEVNP